MLRLLLLIKDRRQLREKAVASQDTVWIQNAVAKDFAVDQTALCNLVLALYDQEHLAIRRYLHFLNIDPDLAEECCQEAFLRLHKHLLSGGDQTNLRAWLFRVARNVALNEVQAARHRLNESLEAAAGSEFADRAPGPEEKVLSKEQEERVRKALVQLNDFERQCLALRAQGFRYREIAEIVGLSVSTVGEHVQRGLSKVRECL